ncbi:hypothetical protein AMD27_15145 [Acinetobacter sp. TGL-Y2]|uniref:CoA-transferase n=1 Tax=Acinetobacter sp. TGL-Y2 TaxID=1407071 RepID=UPI0007A64F4A|nr:CoA-transferase [Acinetobacter sp. TGL-Y2]AMW80100.1 hypothetical protein AMD27_15145 [Acinetobacter sp. TGL-Y2]
MKIISKEHFVKLVQPESTLLIGGFGCCGSPDFLLRAIKESYLQFDTPHSLNLMFISAVGDKDLKGINYIAIEGLIKSTVGGFYGFCPRLSTLIDKKLIEAHNWPLGIFPRYFSEISYGSNGLNSRVGLGSFVDPNLSGGVINNTAESLLKAVMINNEEHIHYPKLDVDFFIFRASEADVEGNISMSKESASFTSMEQILATKRLGGKVVVEVAKISEKASVQDVSIPSGLIDYIIVNNEEITYPTYGHSDDLNKLNIPISENRLDIARTAYEVFDQSGSTVNFGIGISALIPRVAKFGESHISVESGLISGLPLEGLSFGHVENPLIELSQLNLFSMYEAQGIDTTFLGFVEIDKQGRVNASRIGNSWTGIGGFLNIAYSAKVIVFCGILGTRKSS